MIRFIAAIDQKRGLATDEGIPWHLPIDLQYYRDKTRGGNLLMGYNTYIEFSKPMPGRDFVLTYEKNLKEGFEPVNDLEKFIASFDNENLWVIGGAGVFEQTLKYADELYMTRIDADFHCTKFFPEFEGRFELKEKSGDITENGITFHFEVWQAKPS